MIPTSKEQIQALLQTAKRGNTQRNTDILVACTTSILEMEDSGRIPEYDYPMSVTAPEPPTTSIEGSATLVITVTNLGVLPAPAVVQCYWERDESEGVITLVSSSMPPTVVDGDSTYFAPPLLLPGESVTIEATYSFSEGDVYSYSVGVEVYQSERASTSGTVQVLA